MNKFNVLVCGRIRNVDDFIVEMKRYLIWKNKLRIVDRIVISGWKEQYEQHASLIDEFVRNGCEYIALPEPSFRSYGNIINQIKLFYFGISSFSDNDFVLKTRTDGVNTDFDPVSFMDFFSKNSTPGLRSPFEKRIVAQTVFPFQPYFVSDQLLFGQALDLSKLLSFDIWYDAEHAFLNPEQIFHANPHFLTKPLLKSFFRANPGFQYSNPATSIPVYNFLLHNKFFAGAVFESINDIMDSYLLGFHLNDSVEEAEFLVSGDITLTRLIDENVSLFWPYVQYMPLAANIMVGDLRILEHLLRIPISSKLDQKLCDFTASSPWRKNQIAVKCGTLHSDAIDLIDEVSKRFPGQTHTTPYERVSGKKIFHSRNTPFIYC